MTMKLFDVPINFKVYSNTEDNAIASLFHLLKLTIDAEDPEVQDYELFEFIPTDDEDARKYCCFGRGVFHT